MVEIFQHRKLNSLKTESAEKLSQQKSLNRNAREELEELKKMEKEVLMKYS